jgi:rhamnulokinase
VRYAAVDLGASSGRIVVGSIEQDAVRLEEVHRFPNRGIRLAGSLHWDIVHLFAEVTAGLRSAGPLSGIAVDVWGSDYALLGADGRLLGIPFHYRDDRTRGMIEKAFSIVPHEDFYAVTGHQVMRASTIFQLLAEDPALLRLADRLVLLPDLVNYWLTGRLACERSVASTTALLDVHTGDWAFELIERLGLPAHLFGEISEDGAVLGAAVDPQLDGTTVYLGPGHDTACAFAAAPVSGPGDVILSTGTWSLIGVESTEPILGDVAREGNLTHERGVDGTYRVLRNVMGLWLEQECARAWSCSFEDMQRLGGRARVDVGLIDPDHDRFLAPDDMPAEIAAQCRATGQRPLRDNAEIARCIVTSLACKYRYSLDRLAAASGRELTRLHVVGGGAQHRLLCQVTADITGRPVVAGPIEATSIGNVVVQARAAGELESLAQARELIRRSAEIVVYEPSADRGTSDAIYERFLTVTGLGGPALAADADARPTALTTQER